MGRDGLWQRSWSGNQTIHNVCMWYVPKTKRLPGRWDLGYFIRAEITLKASEDYTTVFTGCIVFLTTSWLIIGCFSEFISTRLCALVIKCWSRENSSEEMCDCPWNSELRVENIGWIFFMKTMSFSGKDAKIKEELRSFYRNMMHFLLEGSRWLMVCSPQVTDTRLKCVSGKYASFWHRKWSPFLEISVKNKFASGRRHETGVGAGSQINPVLSTVLRSGQERLRSAASCCPTRRFYRLYIVLLYRTILPFTPGTPVKLHASLFWCCP